MSIESELRRLSGCRLSTEPDLCRDRYELLQTLADQVEALETKYSEAMKLVGTGPAASDNRFLGTLLFLGEKHGATLIVAEAVIDAAAELVKQYPHGHSGQHLKVSVLTSSVERVRQAGIDYEQQGMRRRPDGTKESEYIAP